MHLPVSASDPSLLHYAQSSITLCRSAPSPFTSPDGDHLVGWANSSLRFMHQLPRLPPGAQAAKGVVLQVGRGQGASMPWPCCMRGC